METEAKSTVGEVDVSPAEPESGWLRAPSQMGVLPSLLQLVGYWNRYRHEFTDGVSKLVYKDECVQCVQCYEMETPGEGGGPVVASRRNRNRPPWPFFRKNLKRAGRVTVIARVIPRIWENCWETTSLVVGPLVAPAHVGRAAVPRVAWEGREWSIQGYRQPPPT